MDVRKLVIVEDYIKVRRKPHCYTCKEDDEKNSKK